MANWVRPGLDVLRALLKRMNYASGLCFPSYLTLSAMTGLCRSTIAKALKRLESAGIVRITRRLKRILVTRTSPLTGLPERLMLTTQGQATSMPSAIQRRSPGALTGFWKPIFPTWPIRSNGCWLAMHKPSLRHSRKHSLC
jgi:hypothetical protein